MSFRYASSAHSQFVEAGPDPVHDRLNLFYGAGRRELLQAGNLLDDIQAGDPFHGIPLSTAAIALR
jgi:hypothetical protein